MDTPTEPTGPLLRNVPRSGPEVDPKRESFYFGSAENQLLTTWRRSGTGGTLLLTTYR